MVTFLQRTFTSLVHAHAGRTQSHQPDKLDLWPKKQAFGKFAGYVGVEAVEKPSYTHYFDKMA